MALGRIVDLSAPPPLRTAIVGCLLLAVSFPPIDWSMVAWIAPIPWLVLCRTPELKSRRPYLSLWVAGLIYWLWLLNGIRLAHPALYLGWIALSAYVAVYLPLFIGLTRLAIHRLRVPLVIAAPVVWTGLEITRSYFLTGFAIGLISHSQTSYPVVLQLAAWGGSYLISFVMLSFAAGLTELLLAIGAKSDLPATDSTGRLNMKTSYVSLAWGCFLLAIALCYGQWSLNTASAGVVERPPLKVVLVQGSLDTVFEFSPERAKQTLDHYLELTEQACQKYSDFDLLVWPESSCPNPHFRIGAKLEPPPESGMTAEQVRQRLTESNEQFEMLQQHVARRINAPSQKSKGASFVLGCTSLAYDSFPPSSYNTATLSDPQGKLAQTYDKMHPVMFGEYIPFAGWFPILYRITPMPGGLTPGTKAESFQVNGYRLAPSICFEDTVPHLLRHHVSSLRSQGNEPDFLLNITNDGWFWGSVILDLHFRCAILRSVELRKPLVVAANTGLSAAIDGSGRVIASAGRRQPGLLYAELVPDGRKSFYSIVGDWPLGVCALIAWLLMVFGISDRR